MAFILSSTGFLYVIPASVRASGIFVILSVSEGSLNNQHLRFFGVASE
jgi:hypothetical protein